MVDDPASWMKGYKGKRNIPYLLPKIADDFRGVYVGSRKRERTQADMGSAMPTAVYGVFVVSVAVL